jgi:electron transport complex protein RnfC
MSTNPSLYHFHGGLKLQGHKDESLKLPLQNAGLSGELILRLSQHIGEPNMPVVKIGDTVKRGQLLAESNELVSAPVHAPTSGLIKAIEPRPVAHPSGQSADCFILVPDGLDESFSTTQKPQKSEALTRQELLHLIRKAGIAGLGGAVFPSAAKLQTALEHGIDTLIINGAECEPYITCDDSLMQNQAPEIMRGIALLQTILQVKQTLIGIEDNKPKAIETMQKALQQAALSNTRIVSIPSVYPSGGEKQLIQLLTGKEVISGKLAFDMGILCHNVGTCTAIAEAIDLNQPLISRIVTVTGPGIKNPGNWITPLGTPVQHLIELAGGYKVDQPKLIMGGPMMGMPLQNNQVPVVKATNCILVLDHKDQPEAQECVRCGRCEEVCPAQLLPQQLYWYSKARQFDTTEEYHLFDCIECGCCSAVCPSHIPLVQYYRFAKSEIWEQRQKTYKADRSRQRHEFREARLVKLKQQEEERRRQKREALAKKKQAGPQSDVSKVKKTQTVDAVQAALERVKARKQSQQFKPKNTSNLTEAQQRQIDEAEARRKKLSKEDT